MGNMKYYVYENFTREANAVIHKGSCGYCNYGEGCHRNPLADLWGKWHGPFDGLKEARRDAAGMGRNINKCLCLAKRNPEIKKRASAEKGIMNERK